ncbi:MAG TPA: Glu/Leu/Phe/Val dehydrogenase dimerization domain-containing protein [Acidimicrobiales bacterium]|nr:Glu/Leu/Phe/Val dehydrogenase dimerization domain-containing protein [Acidimicrobiales bacterium]
MADLWDLIGEEYEEVVHCHDAVSGLRAIVAIHSTALGPALGGTRFYPYGSGDDALVDVLRLAKGMTYKSALAGLDLGGGKAVIIGDPATAKTEALLRVYARFVDSLGGRYLTAEDVGTTQADMDLIARETRCVTGTSPLLGGSGDPSEATARGVYWAMRATAAHLEGSGDLAGLHVAVSGVGKVGSALVGLLVADGAKVTVADVNRAAVDRLEGDGVATTDHAAAHSIPCDIFAPCALGAVLNSRTIPELHCRAVVGAANNQLETDADGEELARRGIVYVPDFVVNAGGVINIADELIGYHRERALESVKRIGETTSQILAAAADGSRTTVEAATQLAEARIDSVSATRRITSFPRPVPRPGA